MCYCSQSIINPWSRQRFLTIGRIKKYPWNPHSINKLQGRWTRSSDRIKITRTLLKAIKQEDHVAHNIRNQGVIKAWYWRSKYGQPGVTYRLIIHQAIFSRDRRGCKTHYRKYGGRSGKKNPNCRKIKSRISYSFGCFLNCLCELNKKKVDEDL